RIRVFGESTQEYTGGSVTNTVYIIYSFRKIYIYRIICLLFVAFTSIYLRGLFRKLNGAGLSFLTFFLHLPRFLFQNPLRSSLFACAHPRITFPVTNIASSSRPTQLSLAITVNTGTYAPSFPIHSVALYL